MMRRIDVQIVIALLLIMLGFFAGTLRSPGDGGNSRESGTSAAVEKVPEIWTCSMHPQIRLPKPGKCPICSMDLIPVETDDSDDGDEVTLTMSESAMKLAEIQTTPVVRGAARREVRFVGKVEYDETRVKSIAAWVSGRLDRLYVDYTGISISKGDHLVWMYSPELVSAQEELLQALRAEKKLQGSDVRLLRETAAGTVEAARDKLRLLGLTGAQIEELETRGTVEDHVTIYAPSDGVVISKLANEGAYVETGRTIYEIVDLSRVWVKLDAYESDLAWLRYGQAVRFTTTAYPGKTFEGQISFIDPILDGRSRTVKVRVNVDNSSGLLKPGLFVRASVDAELTADGLVTTADLRGKWIAPMHPEIVKNGPGSCDICGMKLVRAESLGYEPYPEDGELPLLIPASAPLITGRRAVVYVRDPDSERPRFSGREVVLGPRATDHYIVESGLVEGEMVVVNGAFKIDSAMQIQAKPSMMSPEGGVPAPTHNHGGGSGSGSGAPGGSGPAAKSDGHGGGGSPASQLSAPREFQAQLGALYDEYLALAAGLATDDVEAARGAVAQMSVALEAVDMGQLEGDAHMAWMGSVAELKPALESTAGARDIEGVRAGLPALTASIASAIRSFGIGEGTSVLRFHCPMAFDGQGADWLQSETATANPYYGTAMPSCGESIETIGHGETR